MREKETEAETHNFEDDVKINKYKLPEECEKHSSKYYYWAKKLAFAQTALYRAQDQLKLVSAQHELKLRKKWDDKKYGKLTEGSIKAVLETLLAEERANVRAFQKEVGILDAAVSAMGHRKSELDNEVKLLIGGFYSTPNGGTRGSTVDDDSKELRKRLNRDKE